MYDKKNRYYVLGPRYGLRSAGSMKQVKKVAQLLCTADFAKDGSTEDLQSKVDNWPEGVPQEL